MRPRTRYVPYVIACLVLVATCAASTAETFAPKRYEPFNPLEREALGERVADELLATEPLPLAGLPRFEGAGVYALYYSGDHPIYAVISGADVPVYVGKAMPPGARQGRFGLGAPPGPAIHRRLRVHARSVDGAADLDLADFQVRFLVVEDIWIPLGEALLISKFQPAWNRVVDGFGSHDPGEGRKGQARSRWDTLHPGRPWAHKLSDRDETAADIQRHLKAHFDEMKAPPR